MPIDETAQEGAQLTPETMTATRLALMRASLERTLQGEPLGVARWGEGNTQFIRDETIPRDEVYLMSTQFDPNSVASRILRGGDHNSYLYGEPIRSTYRDLNAAPLTNGEPLTPGTCHTCGATGPVVPRPCTTRECHSQVCIDLCVECVGANSYARPPRGAQHAWTVLDEADAGAGPALNRAAGRVSQPSNLTATGALMAQHLEEASRRLNQVAYGDLYGFTPTEGRVRPDHYRVRRGECNCGFTSPFVYDMQQHIDDALVDTGDGIPKRRRLCECGESRLCRRVTVAPLPSINWSNAEFDPTTAPRFEEIYLCDTCCERRGIR